MNFDSRRRRKAERRERKREEERGRARKRGREEGSIVRQYSFKGGIFGFVHDQAEALIPESFALTLLAQITFEVTEPSIGVQGKDKTVGDELDKGRREIHHGSSQNCIWTRCREA